MKLPLIYLLFILLPLISKAQLVVSDEYNFKITPLKSTRSFAVYVITKTIDQTDTIVSKKELYKTGEFVNGRLKKVSEYIDKSVASSTEYYYRDTNVIKCVVQYPREKITETYVYTYDKITNQNIEEIGYGNDKLIYSKTIKTIEDTTITHMFYDHFDLVASEKTIAYYSNDSLSHTSITYFDHQPEPRFTFKYFNKERKLIKEVDSTKHDKDTILYLYDSIGRLNEIQWKRRWQTILSEYKYGDKETLNYNFYVYTDGKRQPTNTHLTCYDNDGDLLYEEDIDYPTGGLPDEVGDTVKKYYENKLIRKVVFTLGGNLEKTFFVEYE